MAEDRILTPEECYQVAYNRNIAIGEAWLKRYPKPEYKTNTTYIFDFDKGASYIWKEGDAKGNDVFIRNSDNSIAIFSKYSHINFTQ